VPESDLVPYLPGFPPGRRWLVIAPHADDETLGLGATLARAAAAGVEIRVAVVTDGARQGDAAEREDEARAAARELGLGPPEFWRFPDRELDRSLPRLRRAVAAAIGRYAPDTVFLTSPVELHPDHRALALATQRALRRRTLLGLLPDRGPRWVAAYEVSAALQPNLLVAGDDGWERKRRAIACYRSQLSVLAYDTVTEAMGRLRCLTLSGSSHAEAFHLGPTRDVVLRSAGGWAALMGSPLGVTRRRPRP
jgi:LmbE family N-acetylglucosaminyl deacetylase